MAKNRILSVHISRKFGKPISIERINKNVPWYATEYFPTDASRNRIRTLLANDHPMITEAYNAMLTRGQNS